jgi:Putative DNA-binding domain
MTLRGLSPHEIKEVHLRNLINGQVPEGKTIDYKRDLPATSDSARKDFLADLCSFANAGGGYIVFGMTESQGLPVEMWMSARCAWKAWCVTASGLRFPGFIDSTWNAAGFSGSDYYNSDGSWVGERRC